MLDHSKGKLFGMFLKKTISLRNIYIDFISVYIYTYIKVFIIDVMVNLATWCHVYNPLWLMSTTLKLYVCQYPMMDMNQ